MSRSRISWSEAEVRLPDGSVVVGRLHWRAATGGATLRVGGDLFELIEAWTAVDADDTGEHRYLAGVDPSRPGVPVTWEVRWVDNSACASCSGRHTLDP